MPQFYTSPRRRSGVAGVAIEPRGAVGAPASRITEILMNERGYREILARRALI